MKLETIKKLDPTILAPYRLEIEEHNSTIKSLTVFDDDGDVVLKIHQPSSYESLQLLEPAKPKMVKKWAVKGQVAGLKVAEMFEAEYEARSRISELENIQRLGDEALKASEVEVPEE